MHFCSPSYMPHQSKPSWFCHPIKRTKNGTPHCAVWSILLLLVSSSVQIFLLAPYSETLSKYVLPLIWVLFYSIQEIEYIGNAMCIFNGNDTLH
jgi:hypothetical protein